MTGSRDGSIGTCDHSEFANSGGSNSSPQTRMVRPARERSDARAGLSQVGTDAVAPIKP